MLFRNSFIDTVTVTWYGSLLPSESLVDVLCLFVPNSFLTKSGSLVIFLGVSSEYIKLALSTETDSINTYGSTGNSTSPTNLDLISVKLFISKQSLAYRRTDHLGLDKA